MGNVSSLKKGLIFKIVVGFLVCLVGIIWLIFIINPGIFSGLKGKTTASVIDAYTDSAGVTHSVISYEVDGQKYMTEIYSNYLQGDTFELMYDLDKPSTFSIGIQDKTVLIIIGGLIILLGVVNIISGSVSLIKEKERLNYKKDI